MPISGPSSYIPTLNEFLPHWAACDAVVSGGKLTVRLDAAGPEVGLAEVRAWRDALWEYAADLRHQAVELSLGSERRRRLRAAAHERLNQFNRKVRAVLTYTEFVDALPKVPMVTAGEERLFAALDACKQLWTKINEAGAAKELPEGEGQLTLLNGYTCHDLQNDLAKLRAAYVAHVEHQLASKLIRNRRNLLQKTVFAALRQYRKTVLGDFASSDPLVLTLPKLKPGPGAAPGLVQVQMEWNAESAEMKLSWEASAHRDLERYEVRQSSGGSYDSDTEAIVATLSKDAPRSYSSHLAIGAPSVPVWFKVYVILKTGHERGSKAVRVPRPPTSRGRRSQGPRKQPQDA